MSAQRAEATRDRQCYKHQAYRKGMEIWERAQKKGIWDKTQDTGTGASGLLCGGSPAWFGPCIRALKVWTSRLPLPAPGHLGRHRDLGSACLRLPHPLHGAWRQAGPAAKPASSPEKANPWDSPAVSLAQGRPSPGLPFAPPPQHLP